MQFGPQLLNLVSAIPLLILLAQPAQPMNVDTPLCLSQDYAKKIQDTKTVICGFPLPAGSGDAPDVPFACHRQVTGLEALLTKELGLQALSANNTCYLSYSETNSHITLNFNVVVFQFRNTVQVRLLPSVSELVGISQTLVITGKSLSTINPEIFNAISPTQKETLKYLVLSDTGIASIDLSLLEPLRIIGLLLINNAQLNRITNIKGVKLPTLTELAVYNSSTNLTDCRSFMSLPEGLTTMYLLQNTLDDCAFCYLPNGVTKVGVLPHITSLPHYPSAVATDAGFPFPLDKPYGTIENFANPVNYKKYNVSASTASGCQSACSCQQWSQTTPSTTGAASPTPPETKPSASSGNASNSGSRDGDGGVVVQSSSGGNAGSRLEASAAGLLLTAAALAMIWIRF